MNTGPNPAPVGFVRLPLLRPLSRNAYRIALAAMLLVPFLMLAVMWQVLGSEPLTQERLRRGLGDSLQERPDHLVAVIAMPFVLSYLAVEQPARLKGRLVVDATGLSFLPLARSRLPLTPRVWSISRARLRKAEAGSPLGPGVMLTLSDGAHVGRIIVAEWVRPDAPGAAVKAMMKQRLPRRQKRVAPEEALRLAEESPLQRESWTRGLTIQRPDAASPVVLGLFKNRHAAVTVALLTVIGLHGAVDIVLLDETYAGCFPWTTWVVGGVTAAAVAWLWLGRVRLPPVSAIPCRSGSVLTPVLPCIPDCCGGTG